MRAVEREPITVTAGSRHAGLPAWLPQRHQRGPAMPAETLLLVYVVNERPFDCDSTTTTASPLGVRALPDRCGETTFPPAAAQPRGGPSRAGPRRA